MPHAVRRVLGYARVSSVEQALGTSLSDQQEALHAYAAKRGLKVHQMYVEAESAVHERFERREQIQTLLASVVMGDLVLVDKIDRWSRDPEFTYASVRKIHDVGAHFYAVGEDCDPSTPEGDTMLGMRILFAREEHKRIKLRMVGTRKLLRAKGLWSEGHAPWGYARQTDRAVKNVLVEHPTEAAKVRQVFALCVRGLSIAEIAREVGVSRDVVAKALHRRTYVGEIRTFAGDWIKGAHPVLIDPKLFADAQASVERRRLGNRPAHQGSETESWWLRNRARCLHCTGKLAAAYAGAPHARRYYFRCWASCTPQYVPVRKAEEQVAPLVLARLLELRQEIIEASEAKPAPVIDVTEKLEALARKRTRYAEAYAEGALTREQLRAKVGKLDAERTHLVGLAAVVPPLAPAQRKAALKEVATMRHAWASATPQERRAIVDTLATTVYLAVGAEPRVVWVTGFTLARRG